MRSSLRFRRVWDSVIWVWPIPSEERWYVMFPASPPVTTCLWLSEQALLNIGRELMKRKRFEVAVTRQVFFVLGGFVMFY